MHTSTGGSLLDEREFLAELAQLEKGMTTRRRTPLAPATTDAAAPEVEHAEPSLRWRLAALAIFVFFVGVGAAGAAVVFHEQVARILAIW